MGDLPHQRLGKWEVTEHLADGGMATVYVGRSSEEPQLVALKVIRREHTRDPAFVAMFLDESKIASGLSHPNIVRVYETGFEGSTWFIAMELVRGLTLGRVVDACQAKGTPLPFGVVAWIGARVADALYHAHELVDASGKRHDIVHRDINPSNVLVAWDGTPKVIDFGLARAADRVSSATAAGVVKGKLAYLAPEQAEGKSADPRADIFALGVTLWEIAVRRRLFKAEDDVATVRRVLAGEIPDPTSVEPSCPPELARVIMRALARSPEDRWQTAAELSKALDECAVQEGKPVGAAETAAFLATLFPDRAPAAKATKAPPPLPSKPRVNGDKKDAKKDTPVKDAAKDDKIRVWDEGAQKMTWLQLDDGSPRTALDASVTTLVALLEARAASADAVTRCRANLELAALRELLVDKDGAVRAARAALAADPKCAPAAWALRRLLHARNQARELGALLDVELAQATTEAARADLLAERARLLVAANPKDGGVLAAWDAALALAPSHPAALKGLELSLDGDPKALAEHLGRLAAAWADERALAAWLWVERAALLEDPAAATEALRRALALDEGLGPVRDACIMHASRHRDHARFVDLLDAAGKLESDAVRGACLELDAACVLRAAMKDDARAVELLTRAASRAPTTPLVDRRVLDELAVVHEGAQRWKVARAARRARLPLLDPSERPRELATMASLAERAGELDTARADVAEARALDPDDRALFEHQERLVMDDPEKHEALWAAEASRTSAPAAWLRAAEIAEARGQTASAIKHLEAAVAANPDDADLVDRLASLLAGSGAEAKAVRERVALYERAADRAADVPRKVAWLERVALLEEEVLGDPKLAARAWSRVLDIEPNRRTAVRGLARTSARVGDREALSRALLQEASATTDPRESDRLRLRAAEALDDARALRIAEEVLKRHPEHEAARALAMRLHERAGRWAELDRELGARIEFEKDPKARARLLWWRADVQRLRLGSVDAALASLRRARATDPSAGDAIVQLVVSKGDPRAVRQALMEVSKEGTPAQRARWLAHAGELDELVLADDRAAAATYQKALEIAPEDAWLAGRRDRVLARADKRGPQPAPGTVSALRAAERDARAKGALPALANALEQELAAMTTPGAKLGALWAEAQLVEWRLPESPTLDVYDRILALAPNDRAALDALLRRAMAAGDRAAVVRALGGLLAQAQDDASRLVLGVMLAAVVEPDERALRHYREALAADPRSPTAALGLMRMAEAHKDEEGVVLAACARAELEPSGKAKAAMLSRAAGVLLATSDRRLGAEAERKARAADLLEQALAADPSSAPAAGTLISLLEATDPARLLAALRAALERAEGREPIVWLGTELARVAGARPADRPLAVSALERVRGVAPDHVPTLLALADAYAAQGAHRHAATTWEEAAAQPSADAASKKRALLALAEVHRSVFHQTAQVESALRRACDVDPKDAAALRGLLECLRPRAKDDADARAEVARRLAALAEVDATPEARGAAWVELADLQIAASDRGAAERSLSFAAAEAPSADVLARVEAFCATPPSGPADHARMLKVAAERAAELGRPSSPLLVALAELEIGIGDVSSGVVHARAALGLDPSSHDARAAQARGLSRVGSHREAIAMAMPLFDQGARPLLALARPDALLEVLEASMQGAGRDQEALVVREVRAVGGAVNDAVVVGLRARRLPDLGGVGGTLARETLLARVVPREGRHLLLDVAIALAGAEGRCFEGELEGLGARTPVPSHHAIAIAFARAARELGLEGAQLQASEGVWYPRAFHHADPLVVVPPGLAAQPEPVQAASVARALARIALGVPWADRVAPADVRALLTAGARVIAPRYAEEDGALVDLAAAWAKPLGRGVARKHKKALAPLEDALAEAPAPKQSEVDAILLAVMRAELRVAFLLTGDLLATLDDLRAADGDYARAATARGSAALAATLGHPLAGDVVRFALGEAATALRRELGTVWTPEALGSGPTLG